MWHLMNEENGSRGALWSKIREMEHHVEEVFGDVMAPLVGPISNHYDDPTDPNVPSSGDSQQEKTGKESDRGKMKEAS